MVCAIPSIPSWRAACEGRRRGSWVADWYDENYCKSSPTRNPQGPASGDKAVVRGGWWGVLAGDLLAHVRYSKAPAERLGIAKGIGARHLGSASAGTPQRPPRRRPRLPWVGPARAPRGAPRSPAERGTAQLGQAAPAGRGEGRWGTHGGKTADKAWESWRDVLQTELYVQSVTHSRDPPPLHARRS
jgi:hypothetical protein